VSNTLLDALSALKFLHKDAAEVDSFDYAHATDDQLGELALDAGELAFRLFVALGMASRDCAHLRVGNRDRSQPDGIHPTERWQRSVNPSHWTDDYDKYSLGKLITAGVTGMNSDVAGRTAGVQVPKAGLNWNGGVNHLAVATDRNEDYSPGPVLAEFESDGSMSGVQGSIDKIVAAFMAYAHAELRVLRYKAQHGIA
jgi:hypothetical protein